MSDLKGTNRIDDFRIIAEEIVSYTKQYKEVEGILYIGGLTRGFVDQYSDLDIIVLLNNENKDVRDSLNTLAKQKHEQTEIEVDIEIYCVDEFMKRELHEFVYCDLSNSIVVFDRNNEVRKALDNKLAVSEDEWCSRIVPPLVHLSWYCCPTSDVASMVDVWKDRDHILSAQYSVNYSMELVLQLVYFVNRSFLPAPKWRLYHLRNLDWIPDEFDQHIEEIMRIDEISILDAKRRVQSLSELTKSIRERCQSEFGLKRSEIRRIYLAEVYGIE